MLSICRMVPTDLGQSDLQHMERYRDIDFPSTGPLQATDRQKAILEEALDTISLQDHGSSRDAQIVLVSSRGRIVAIENITQPGMHNRLKWVDLPRVASPLPTAGSYVLPTFMCEEQTSRGNTLNPHCFEVTDSRRRCWTVYEVRAGLVDQSEFPAMSGIQICEREDLADRLGRV